MTYARSARNLRPSPSTWMQPPTKAIEACGGDAREAVKGLLVLNDFLEQQLDEFRSKISAGYARGRLPRAGDRKE